jgi:hypothetical protein
MGDLEPPKKFERALGIIGTILVFLIMLYLTALILIWLTGKALS